MKLGERLRGLFGAKPSSQRVDLGLSMRESNESFR